MSNPAVINQPTLRAWTLGTQSGYSHSHGQSSTLVSALDRSPIPSCILPPLQHVAVAKHQLQGVQAFRGVQCSWMALNSQLTRTNISQWHLTNPWWWWQVNQIVSHFKWKPWTHDESERKGLIPALRGPLLVTACWILKLVSSFVCDCCSFVSLCGSIAAHWPPQF